MLRIGFFVGHERHLRHAITLAESLQRTMKTAPIYVMVPAALHDVFLKSFAPLALCTVYAVDIPEEIRSLPFADKLAAAAAFEAMQEDAYLWMDVDSYVQQELPLDAMAFPLCVNPVDMRNIGIPRSESLDEFWTQIYTLLDVDPVTAASCDMMTQISRESIWPYFNMGFIMVNDPRHLLQKSWAHLLHLLQDEIIQSVLASSYVHKIFIHQAALTVTILKEYGLTEINPLPTGVNYPLHLMAKDDHRTSARDLISVRYDTLFNDDSWQTVTSLPQPLIEHHAELMLPWYY